jgi:hypothetical protein
MDDVALYIVRYSLGCTQDMLEEIVEERNSGGWKNGFFDKNKRKDLRILKDHIEAVKIVKGWYEVPKL